jgi:hypothetical protein
MLPPALAASITTFFGCFVSRSTPTKLSSKPLEERDNGTNADSFVDYPIGRLVYLG